MTEPQWRGRFPPTAPSRFSFPRSQFNVSSLRRIARRRIGEYRLSPSLCGSLWHCMSCSAVN